MKYDQWVSAPPYFYSLLISSLHMMTTLPPLPKLSGPGTAVPSETPSCSPMDTSSLLPCATSTPTDDTLSDSLTAPVSASSSILDVSGLDSTTTSTDTSKTVKDADVIVDIENGIAEVEVVTIKQKNDPKANKKQERWTNRESECLITLVISEKYQNRFNGGKMSHKNIWTQLAKELNENLLKDGQPKTFNWQSCRDKFKNLRNKYKEIKKKQDQSGSAAEAVEKFPGWAEMDVFYCQNPSIKPEFTASSIKPKGHEEQILEQEDKESSKTTA